MKLFDLLLKVGVLCSFSDPHLYYSTLLELLDYQFKLKLICLLLSEISCLLDAPYKNKA